MEEDKRSIVVWSRKNFNKVEMCRRDKWLFVLVLRDELKRLVELLEVMKYPLHHKFM
jgi:hypothetical protein